MPGTNRKQLLPNHAKASSQVPLGWMGDPMNGDKSKPIMIDPRPLCHAAAGEAHRLRPTSRRHQFCSAMLQRCFCADRSAASALSHAYFSFPPEDCPMTQAEYASCIDACIECARACEHCADSCLSEQDVSKMAECIRLDRDCAEACWAAAAWMSRESRFAAELCRLCAEVCEACGAECGKHSHDHCRRCAEACRACADACREMVSSAA